MEAPITRFNPKPFGKYHGDCWWRRMLKSVPSFIDFSLDFK